MAAIMWRAKAFAVYHLLKTIVVWIGNITLQELLRVVFPSIQKSMIEKAVSETAEKLEESESGYLIVPKSDM